MSRPAAGARGRRWRPPSLRAVAAAAALASLLLQAPVVDARYAYTWHPGAFAQGGDLGEPEIQTLTQGKARCDSMELCCGLTFKGPDRALTTAVKIFLKQDCGDANTDKAWNHYIRGAEITSAWVYFATVFLFGMAGYAAVGSGYNFLVRGKT
eukprot:SAG22_NODE_82_length_21749_cov_10.719769_14_plen_153_part_00